MAKEITCEDIDKASNAIRRIYKDGNSSAGAEDFVQAGLLGLVVAAKEYDEKRAGWGTLSRWRYLEHARSVLRWSLRFDRECSLDKILEMKGTNHEKLSLGKEDDEAPLETKDFLEFLVSCVSGDSRSRIARSMWIDGYNQKQTAEKLGLSEPTVSTQLTYARYEAYEALSQRFRGDSLYRACKSLRGLYGPEKFVESKQHTKNRLKKRNQKKQRHND